MKKHLHFYLFLFAIPIISLVLVSNSGGANASLTGFTGSPGDVNDCTACHTGADTNTSFNLSTNVTTNIPSGGYALGQTYTITVTQTTSGGATEHGFQVTAENNFASKVGTFVITDATNTQLKGITNNFVTHTLAGANQTSWSFDWTAPSFDIGTITFYVASLTGSGGGVSNTQMELVTKLVGPVLAVDKAHMLQFTMFPNPSDRQVTLQLPSDTNQAQVSVFDYLGKIHIQKSINVSNNTVDISNLNTGIYFVRIQTNSKTGIKKLVVR